MGVDQVKPVYGVNQTSPFCVVCTPEWEMLIPFSELPSVLVQMENIPVAVLYKQMTVEEVVEWGYAPERNQ